MPDSTNQTTSHDGDSPSQDESVYRQRKVEPNFNKTPWCIYFYYIGEVNDSGYRLIRHYFYEDIDNMIEKSDVQNILIRLSINARKNEDEQVPPPDGSDLNFIVWMKKSYIVFLVDDPGIVLSKDAALDIGSSVGGTSNHSFFDAWDMQNIDVSEAGDGSRIASAICCINHMKANDAGDDLGSTAERFRFKLHPNPRHPLYPDSGGTNMGPAVPPP